MQSKEIANLPHAVSGSAYCKRQSLAYHQFIYWRRKLAPTEDCLKQVQDQVPD
ncbi:hypothetical protein MIH18_18550 [Marinobacter sp. M3C]|jgi:hypothetical protein|uniref:IS66 family insertion sequence element accessory protein TnpA n=1 Tax=unclassified Marinobacter TaxID=83889 RepID=UPI00200DFC2F|nr:MULTISPECIES: hypothetical protein [unclassified Marinobacter]MCL1478737.1 hypothetical protein [Marinobacter sp.]MCL1481783.1 hypothetical protein [Marinobacter sp.]MCL1484496.1 hypothetical protein [Marinobacter sp.]UQG54934.1 hypothetical protein MIH16_16085 [Marinobacter sp. M4C]UQG59692.1 hypothetical protein MIH18_18550 [Marinobacter sp. M3C]